MSKLSIVIPVYNGAAYIENCLKNLEMQTFLDWEAIFVNDGSTDQTGDLLDGLTRENPKCSVIHKENGGTARARNAGLAKAKSLYVTFMDVDDELDPKMYEKLVGLLDSTQADVAICGYFFKVEGCEGQTAYLEKKYCPSCVLREPQAFQKELLRLWESDLLYNVWNKVYRLAFLQSNKIMYREGQVYNEDMIFNWAVLERCKSLAVTEECLYYYVRERTGSTSEKYRTEYFDIRLGEYREFYRHFEEMNLLDDKGREYICRRFIERVAGTVENVFHAEKQLTEAEKRKRIQEIISHPDVREALQYARCRSKKMKLLIAPIKSESVYMTYFLYKAVYEIRKQNPVLFHKLKGRR